jgi:tRNA 5-methylaminomethyl-2-thiouridine biosynthesis bifunctional protein
MDRGVLFGATHDRDVSDTDVRPEDHARNLDLLAKGRPSLAAAVAGKVLQGRAGIRAATPDRLPLAGQIAPGLFTLTGLGSRGFTTAPLLAEHVAALVVGRPSPLPVSLAHLIRPIRNGAGR